VRRPLFGRGPKIGLENDFSRAGTRAESLHSVFEFVEDILMNRTFKSEDARKNKLFEAWIAHLTEFHSRFKGDEFDEIYEGIAVVSDLSKNRIGLDLDDGRKIRDVPISPQVSSESCRLDSMYVVLGLKDGKWWTLDVISIGSVLNCKKGGAHVTFNPLYVNPSHRQNLAH
jgi:hypothetical protein